MRVVNAPKLFTPEVPLPHPWLKTTFRPSHLSTQLCSSSVVLLLGLSSVHAGSLQIQIDNPGTLAQWTVNQAAVTQTDSFTVPDTTTATLALDGSAYGDTYALWYTNTTSTPGQLTLNLFQGSAPYGYPLLVDQPQGLVLFDGTGVAANNNGRNGPVIQGETQGSQLPFSLTTGQFNGVSQGPTAVIQYRSRGAMGTSTSPTGGNGGAITVDHSAEILVGGTLGDGNSSLPWRPAAAVLSLRSVGGNGAFQRQCTPTCFDSYGSGGDGGDVTLHLQNGAPFVLSLSGFNSQLPDFVATSPGAPLVGILAHSQGGMGVAENNLGFTGDNGKGGAVNVSSGQMYLDTSSSYVMGIVAASVGGATAPPAGAKADVVPSGAGGNVTVALDRAQINLRGNNGLGVVATSTGDVIVPANSELKGDDPATFGDVNVELGPETHINVGSAQPVQHSPTDTNIGVLALSSPGWATQPFTGAEVSTMHSPGTPGNVEVSISPGASVQVYGSGAIGVLAQSIAGNGASASGGTRAFVGDQGGPGGTAGTVSLNNVGGSINTTGDGAVGALLQSIAGGGGNGGNAAGLFVAVGGSGGQGGQGGEVRFVQGANASITTQGDYAQGVVLQSIGGGGGNGGFAKAYSLVVPVATGIGGSAGIGGAGGDIRIIGESTGSVSGDSQITTAGQHAHGLVAHTIGGGGGTGGAATTVDASLFTLSVAVGGNGAGGGDGGLIGGYEDDPATPPSITTTGHDAHGLLLQSIGAGGGTGGGSAAAALSAFSPDDIPTINIGVAVGGNGGDGGAGNQVNVRVQEAISTRGAGAHGVLLQSIGGGGGTGADSTAGAGAFLDSASFNFNSAVSVGGAGGHGGSSGPVFLEVAAPITTQGHHAVGITAQSVGGGGGVAGIGNAAAVIGAPLEEAAMQLNFGVGGSGGTGGGGNSVEVTVQAGSSVNTAGAGAIGILAQSVGGGGGVAGNAGAQAIGGKFSQNLTVGGNGGSGNDADTVDVTFAGNISTGNKYQIRYTNQAGATALTTAVVTGGNAHGIVAQSIGGGGGIGGHADPAASIVPDLAGAIIDDVDKLFDLKGSLLWWAKKIVDFKTDEYEFPKSFSSKVAVGGSGGAAGDGSDVSVSLTPGSRIATLGHRSYAVMAQSIGGGGGAGGAASGDSLLDTDIGLSPLTGFDFDLGINVGGAGGNAGAGGDLNVTVHNAHNSTLDNRLVSSGYGSHLLLLQSIGGGGGLGHEGSLFGLSGKLSGFNVPSVTLGDIQADGGGSGSAGNIQLGTTDTPVIGLFETGGDDAAVVLAQSIGGGGGLASFGCTNSGRAQSAAVASPCYTNTSTATGSTPVGQMIAPSFVNTAQTYALGIQGNAGGTGGLINMVLGDAGMHTTGDRAPVIIAQTISGAGGYAAADRRNVASTQLAAGATALAGSSDILITASNTEITTAGHGSWGILAQSIAGGGGLLGDTSADLLSVPSVTQPNWQPGQREGYAGDITIQLSDRSTIRTGDSTHGAFPVNTHGIVAQSLGAGGGIQSGNNQSLQAPLQLTALGDLPLSSGAITVEVDPGSSIDAQGIGAIGVLAQVGGLAYPSTAITININGTVTGGRSGVNPLSKQTLDGVGIMLSGAGESPNLIQVGAGGVLTTQNGTQSGYAIRTDYGSTQVNNSGTITGSVDLGTNAPGNATNNTFINHGTFAPGPVINVPGSQLQNHGMVQVGEGNNIVTSRLIGDFEQTDTGRLTFATSTASGTLQHSQLVIQGSATIAGNVAVFADDLLPGTLPVLKADQLNLSAAIEQPLLFRWQAQATGNSLSLTPSANFRPLGVGLNPSASSLANYLQRGWQNADASKARLFGYLSQVQRPQNYQSTLQQLGGQSLLAQSQQLVQTGYDILGDSLSCPSAAAAGVRQTGESCTWARLSGSRADQSGTDNTLGYHSQGGGLRIGFQQALTPTLRLGASAGASQNRLNANDFSSKGNTYDAAVALSHQRDGLELTGAVAVARGNFRNERTPQLGATGQTLGLNHTYDSKNRTTLVGARLRTAYTFTAPTHYVKPYLDLDVIHTRSPGFTESGNGPLALEVGTVNKTQVVVSPMLEVGTQRELKSGLVVRGYVAAGASVLPNNQRTTENRLASGQAGNGTFNLTREGPKAVGRFNLGVEVQAPKQQNLSFRAEYSAQAGGRYRSQSVSARLNYRF